MGYIVKNNAYARLASSIASADTAITVETGKGSLFAVTSPDYTFATLEDSSGNIEVVKVTARSGDVLTVVRGQDGTTARAWNIGDIIECRPCKAAFDAIRSELQGLAVVKTGDTMTGALTVPNAGIRITDTSGSTSLALATGSALSVNRTLTITTGDANRELDLLAMSNGLTAPSVSKRLRVSVFTSSTVDILADLLTLRDPSTGKTRIFSNVSASAQITLSGAGGLDAGSEAANTWYYVYVIAKNDGTLTGLLSTSSNAPVLPSGYVYYALVSAVKNDASSNFIGFVQRGARVYLAPRQQIVSNGTATTETSVSVAAAVPQTAHEVLIDAEVYSPRSTSATEDFYLEVRIGSGMPGFFTTAGRTSSGSSSSSAAWNTTAQWIPHATSQSIVYLMSTSAGGQYCNIYVHGFTMPICGD